MGFDTPDVDRIRGNVHEFDPVIVNAVPLIPVASARVNQTTFAYPLAQIAVDTMSDWTTQGKRGRMFSIGTAPGFADITWGILKRDAIANFLFMDAKSLGDPGYAREIHLPILNDHYITVYKYRPPWGLMSAIRNGVFYKQYDIPYDGSGSNPNPWLKMGEWRQEFVGPGGTATLPFTLFNSYYWDKNFASCLWNFDGGVATLGDATDPDVEVEFEPGFHEVTCRVVDTKGRATIGYRYVWINTTDPDDPNSPLSYRYNVKISGDTQDRLGRNLTVNIDGPIADGIIFPGQAFHIKENAKFSGEVLDDDHLRVDSYVGYADDRTTTIRKGSSVSIKLMSPLGTAGKVPTATQLLEEVKAPNDWTQCTTVLSNPIGAAWYIGAHHAPFIIEGHDFEFDMTLVNRRRKSFGFQAVDIGSQYKQLAEMTLSNIGCKSNGRIRFVRFPHYFSLVERDLLDNLWTIIDQDIEDDITIPLQYRMTQGQVFGYAFAFDGSAETTPFAALAPGNVKAQNPGVLSMTPFMVPFAAGQYYTELWTGMHHARMANPIPDFNVKFMNNMDFWEPCDVDKLTLFNVDASYDPLNYGWINKRILPTRISRTWSVSGKKVSGTFEALTYGQKGIFQPVDRGAGDVPWTNQWNPGLDDSYQPEMPDLGLDYPVVLALNNRNLLGRTFTFTDRYVYWGKISVPGVMRDVVVDPFSPFITNTGSAVRALVVSDFQGKITVWRINDVKVQNPVVAKIAEFTPHASYNGKVHIRASRTDNNFFLVGWKDGQGVMISQCTGSWTFNTPVRVGAELDPIDTYHANDDLGMDLYNERQVIVAPDGNLDEDGHYQYHVYTSDDKFEDTFAYVNNIPAGSRLLLGSITLTSDEVAQVPVIDPEPPDPPEPLGIVTFDPGGYEQYDIGPYSIGVFEGSNAEYNPMNGFTHNGVQIEVDLGADYLFHQLTFTWGTDGQLGSPIVEANIWRTDIVFQNSDGVEVGRVDDIRYGEDGFFDEVTASDGKVIDYVRYVTIEITYDFTPLNTVGIWYLYMDNIDIQATLIDYSSKIALYAVNVDSETWNINSPKQPDMPNMNYAMAWGSNLSLIGKGPNNYSYLYAGNSSGSNFTRLGRVKYVGAKRGFDSDGFIGFGFGAIDLSPDQGRTVYPRIGDWSAKVGPVETIITVTGVI